MDKEFKERVIRAAYRTWAAIGADCLIDEDGELDESATMSREEVIQMVTDADRIKFHGGLSKADAEEFYKLSRKDRNSLMKEAFPYKNYGW